MEKFYFLKKYFPKKFCQKNIFPKKFVIFFCKKNFQENKLTKKNLHKKLVIKIN